MSAYRTPSGPSDSGNPRPRNRATQPSSQPRGRRSTAKPQSRSGAPRSSGPKRPLKPSTGRRAALWRGLGLLGLALLIAGLVTAGVVYASISSSLPDPNAAAGRGRDQTTVITDRDGRMLTRLFAEQNRSDQPLSKIPESLQEAVISTEDQRFYEHSGVDPLGIARAIYTDVLLRSKAQGGSTITQQYVKQAFVGDESSLNRKVKEAMLAQRVEKKYSKAQILEFYLNTIYFGHGAYGVEAASQVYFGKSVSKLTLPESAMIAGVIKSPARYSPYLEKVDAKRRRDTVLAQMRDEGYITPAQFASAVKGKVKTVGLKRAPARAPYFVEWIKSQLEERFGQDQLYRGGLVVKTTLDPGDQKAAEKAISSTLDRKKDPSAALVAIKPGTGEVVAMVGGRDFETQQFNAAVQGNGRQPGSAFKPFVLATALGDDVSPEQTFKSGAAKLAVGNQTWKVTGAHGGSSGAMRLRVATEQSVNSVFARLILKVTPEKVVETAEKMGLHTGITPVPAIALGGLEGGVTPLEMADAYATLAAGGKHVEPFGIVEVRDADGTVLFAAKPKTRKAIDPAVAYLTTDILEGVIKRGTGTAAAIGRPAAGKTGTTQQYRDAWFVGYTPQLATAVWMGYPEAQTAMTDVHGRAVTGGSFPAQMWAKFMRAALAGKPSKDFNRPDGLRRETICRETGLAATRYCPKTQSAPFLDSMELKTCVKHVAPKKITVPNLVGMTKEAALVALEKLKLKATVVETSVEGVAAGVVSEQNPRAGSTATTVTVVTLTVSNGDVSNEAPTADFVVPTDATSGAKTTLDGSLSRDDGRIAKWYWEFGDGGTGTGRTTAHTWTEPGSYDVTLWVTDNKGQQASVTKRIEVN